jgi:hypothetical protein
MLNVKSSHNYRDKQRKRQEHYNLEVGITLLKEKTDARSTS